MFLKSIVKKNFIWIVLIGLLLLAACSPAAPMETGQDVAGVDVQYTLTTSSDGGRLLFVGVGGDIDGQENPDLFANEGDTVSITLVIGDGRFHDIVIDEFNAATPVFGETGQEETIQFVADQAGTFFYYCSVSGHRQSGMEGQLIIAADG
jgi:nitrite reductase (NO-forming)